jgi:hypothetical protein
MMVGDEPIRRSAVDGRSRMTSSGTLRGAQQSREWLGDCSGDAEEAVVYRIRLIEPISTDFAVLVGDAIRNLRSSHNQVAYQLAVQHSGPLTEDAERMTELPIRSSGAQFDDWATSKNKQTKLRRSEIFGKRGSGRFARDSRSPSG